MSYRLNAVYRPLDALAFTVTLPVVSKTIHTVGCGTSVLDSDLTGLGDIDVAARYTAWRSVSLGVGRVHEVALTVGTSMPSGNYNAKAADGSLIDPHGQLGTGGWGPFLGLHYHFEQGNWYAFASASYRWRTEATYFDGSKYKFGNAALWSVHGRYWLGQRVALALGVDGRYAHADNAVDADGTVVGQVVNTGGTLLSLAPGVYLRTVRQLWFFARGQVPVYKGLFGEQDVKPSVTVGFQVQIL